MCLVSITSSLSEPRPMRVRRPSTCTKSVLPLVRISTRAGPSSATSSPVSAALSAATAPVLGGSVGAPHGAFFQVVLELFDAVVPLQDRLLAFGDARPPLLDR